MSLRWIAFVLALAPASASLGQQDPLSGLGELLTACAAGESCVLVETVPCGCAAGGSYLAVNRRYAELWAQIEAYLREQPPEVMCPQLYRCNDHSVAICEQGRCRVGTR
ncbi:MAG: hypothetical protein U1E52_03915 [Geminicoccaceae bacterium]